MIRKSFICAIGVLAGASAGAYSDGFFNEQNVVTDSIGRTLEKYGFQPPEGAVLADGTTARARTSMDTPPTGDTQMATADVRRPEVDSVDMVEPQPDAKMPTKVENASKPAVVTADADSTIAISVDSQTATVLKELQATKALAELTSKAAAAALPDKKQITTPDTMVSAKDRRAAIIAEAEKALADVKEIANAEAELQRAEAENRATAKANVLAAAEEARQVDRQLRRAELEKNERKQREQAVLEVRFSKEVYESSSGEKLLYRKLAPRVKDVKELPLVIFLHGQGERGNDNKSQLNLGLKYFASAEGMQAFPATVIVPQCPTDQRWSETFNEQDGSTALKSQPTNVMRLTMELIDSIQLTDSIDPDRIYVTGISMGGYGTFDLIARRPMLFAAAAPLCGGGDSSLGVIKRTARTPLWVIHGTDDQTVNVNQSRSMVYALESAGAPVRYSELEGFGHNVWDAAYSDAEFYNWMFNQSRRGPINANLQRTQIRNALIADDQALETEVQASASMESDAADSMNSKIRAMDETMASETMDRAIESPLESPARSVLDRNETVKDLTSASAEATQPAAAVESHMIEGRWKVLAAFQKGKQAKPAVLKKMNVVIEGDNFVVQTGDQQEVAKIVLSDAATPRQIDIVSNRQGVKDSQGIYQVRGDRLIVCWGAPGEERPAQFINFKNVKSLVLQRQ